MDPYQYAMDPEYCWIRTQSAAVESAGATHPSRDSILETALALNAVA